MISDDQLRRFQALYVGSDFTHGVWHIDRTTKQAETEHGPATVEHFTQHFAGRVGLGLVPLVGLNRCRFAAIDIDVDTVDHGELYRHVQRRRMPLSVCRSKSGGAHLYLFLPDPGVDAAHIRARLARWAAVLGYPTAEVFPKQDAIDPSKKKYGNWINLPYFANGNTTRYAVGPDGALSLDDFLASVVVYHDGRAEVDETPDAAPEPAVAPTDRSAERASKRRLPPRIDEHQRNNSLFLEGCALRGRGHDTDEIYTTLSKLNKKRGNPPLPDSEVRRIVASVGRYDPNEDTFPRSDTGNAECFAALFGDRARYDHARRRWFHFEQHRYVADRDGTVGRYALDAIRYRQMAAPYVNDADERKRAVKWAHESESRTRRDNLLACAKNEMALADKGDDWDLDPWLLGVPNGVVDLRTGELRDGRHADQITKSAATWYDPRACCPRFEQFISEIFGGDEDVAAFVQRSIGYSLTGITTQQCFWILYGEGSNGKGTLLELLHRHVLGAEDYGWVMPFPARTFSKQASGDYNLAALVSRRFVIASEMEQRGVLNEEIVKRLTGCDTINARHPYGRPFNFVPVAKFWIAVNEKPVIRDQSHGMWRRVRLINFNQTFPVNDTLPDTLKAEAPGVLAWAVRGCLDWQHRGGLDAPESVLAATRAYRDESDPLTQFLEECCVIESTATVTGLAAYRAYCRWCDERGQKHDKVSQTAFGNAMKKRFDSEKKRHVTYFGVGLLDTHRDDESDL